MSGADQPSSEPSPAIASRYRRVQEILDLASGDAHPDYDGYGRFWKLPLAEFLTVTIYGVRMIAPPRTAPGALAVVPAPSPIPTSQPQPAGSCCGGGGGSHGPAPSLPVVPAEARRSVQPGRGSASGLIRGLKGAYPFDGTQFPPLPWGGSPVAASDIVFIEQWIDDGCPPTDEPADDEDRRRHRRSRSLGDEEHPRSPRTLNAFHAESGTLMARKNIDYLTPEELERFRAVISNMYSYNSYYQDERSFDFWARIHGSMCQHGWEEFLTWHRLYLYNFEQQMQDVDPTVTLPYWDWTAYPQNIGVSQPDTGIVPEAYRAWLDEPALERLKGTIPDTTWDKLAAIRGQKFDSGARLIKAAGIDYTADLAAIRLIMDAIQKVNPLWHEFRWPGGGDQLLFEGYPRPEDVENILTLPDFFPFGSGPGADHYFGALENIHNLIHNFAGGLNPNWTAQNSQLHEPQFGDMQNPGGTAFDPIFWGHHSNVDRIWSEWQQRHPGVGPDDPDAILPPWSMSVGDVANTANLGYEYVKSAHLFETDRSMPIVRFRSAEVGVHPAVLGHHRRAEIRLHHVLFSSAGGGFIRAFLNEPDANADTPTRDNPHFVGQFALFSGGCVGGPGHCDPPPKTRRKFDLRPRHHRTPGHIRFDATEAVARLVAAGATDLRVNLVVMGLDGRPRDDVLRMDAVTLVFKD